MAEIELERKAYDKLVSWKQESNGSTAILIDGARRVGKSHLAKRFAKNEYRSHLIIDFSKVGNEIKDIFQNEASDLDMFFYKLRAATRTELHDRESVIIFDEVQQFPRARELIKHLVADGRYDYVETGSLMSIKENTESIVIPSEEDVLYLNPLDFEEFLWATGDHSTVPLLKKFFDKMEPLGDAAHRMVMNSFRKYMLVGGMPVPVIRFIETKEFSASDIEKRRIVDLYRQDVTKYAKGYEGRVRSIYNNIPSQLSKREKRFKLSSLEKNARSRDYEDAFMWLEDGRIINQCFNTMDPSVGLSMYIDETSHKCYMADTGLLITQSIDTGVATKEDVYKSILLDKMNLNEGAFMENIVAQMLHANGYRLFFYSRSDNLVRENDMEIDFLIVKNGKVCPIEVKSSPRITHTSLDKFRRKFKGRIGQPYILCTKDIGEKDGVVYLPVYMAMFL